MINNNLTIEYKKILQSNKLVDSGKLLNSIKVDVFESGNDIIVNVISLPYLIYLVKDYKLSQQFTNSKSFENEIGGILYSKTEEYINNILNGVSSNISEPQIILKYNGV